MVSQEVVVKVSATATVLSCPLLTRSRTGLPSDAGCWRETSAPLHGDSHRAAGVSIYMMPGFPQSKGSQRKPGGSYSAFEDLVLMANIITSAPFYLLEGGRQGGPTLKERGINFYLFNKGISKNCGHIFKSSQILRTRGFFFLYLEDHLTPGLQGRSVFLVDPVVSQRKHSLHPGGGLPPDEVTFITSAFL